MNAKARQLAAEVTALDNWGFNNQEIIQVLGLTSQEELDYLRNLDTKQERL